MATLPLDLHQGCHDELEKLGQFLEKKSVSGYVVSYKTFGMQEVLYSFGLLPEEVVEAMNRAFHLWRHSYCYVKIKGMGDNWVSFSRHRDCCKVSYDIPDDEETIVCNQDFADFCRKASCILPALQARVIEDDFTFGGNNCTRCAEDIVKALQDSQDAEADVDTFDVASSRASARVTWMTSVPNGYRFPLDRRLLSCKYRGVHFASQTLHEAQLVRVGEQLVAYCPVQVDAVQIGTGCCQINMVLKMNSKDFQDGRAGQEAAVESFLVSFREKLRGLWDASSTQIEELENPLPLTYTDQSTLQTLVEGGILEKIESKDSPGAEWNRFGLRSGVEQRSGLDFDFVSPPFNTIQQIIKQSEDLTISVAVLQKELNELRSACKDKDIEPKVKKSSGNRWTNEEKMLIDSLSSQGLKPAKIVEGLAKTGVEMTNNAKERVKNYLKYQRKLPMDQCMKDSPAPRSFKRSPISGASRSTGKYRWQPKVREMSAPDSPAVPRELHSDLLP